MTTDLFSVSNRVALISGGGSGIGGIGSYIAKGNHTPYTSSVAAVCVQENCAQYSRFPTVCFRRLPMRYPMRLLCCDLLALVLLTTGIADATPTSADKISIRVAGYVMLGGIVIQFVTLLVLVVLAVETISRYLQDRSIQRPGQEASRSVSRGRLYLNLKLQIVGLIFVTIFFLLRFVYRSAIPGNSWRSTLLTKQVYSNVLDGAMIFLAMVSLNVFHPGFLLPGNRDTSA